MRDTDIININLNITVRQARYLRRKMLDDAKGKLRQAKRDKVSHYENSIYFLDYVMLIGLAAYLEEQIKNE